jgi:uncharacterized membrane protein
MNRNTYTTGMGYYLSMGLVVLSIVFYQLFQKNISSNIHPLISLIITYAVALVLSVILLFVFPVKGTLVDSVKQANLASYLLGISIVGIEAGYLLIYRFGWKLSISTAVSSSSALIVLIFIGIIFYKEHLTVTNIIGVLLCLIGVSLLSVK